MANAQDSSNGGGAKVSSSSAPRRRYVSQSDVPRYSIADALRIARTLSEQYGKQPTRPMDVAAVLEMTPSAGPFKMLTGASVAYGFTDGGAQADEIALTDLGRRVVAPTEEGDDVLAMREALLRPRIVREFLEKYDGSKLPRDDVGRNVLEQLGVTERATERTLKLIVASADGLGLLRDIKDGKYVNLRGTANFKTADEGVLDGDEHEDEEGEVVAGERADAEEEAATPAAPSNDDPGRVQRPNRLFVGHGKNKKPLSQLTRTLDNLGIPYLVAEDEPNMGRPISQKVRDTMEQCGAGILIFSADEQYFDKDRNAIWKPSENISHELGAAAVMYDNRVILFKEEAVQLATNYSGIGYIEFEKDKLDSRVNDLLKELMGLGVLKLSLGG